MALNSITERPRSALPGSDATHCTWRNEYTLDDVTWGLIEEDQMEASEPGPVEARP